MNGYSGNPAPLGGMYVKALYDYTADDKTSLSFRQGDIIQVITTLESGWWDGIIGNNVRGWFPSNYCAIIPGPESEGKKRRSGRDEGGDMEDEARVDSEDDGYEDMGSDGNLREDASRLPIETTEDRDQEEAAFWIPQATPDGRLFYFNTLTGVSTMELPLEAPTSATENGPRDRTNIYIPDQTRPPPELMAGGYERDDDTDYETPASDVEGQLMSGSRDFLVSITTT